jgi:CRP-like cAMP-binding protein
MDPWIAAGSVSAWVVPGVIFLVVIVASAVGLLWIRSEHLETLRAVPFFSGLSRHDLMSVLRSTSGVGFERGAELVKEVETGKGFFIMTRGTAAVSVGGTQVDTLGPGSYFGEMAVLDGGPRTATITATGQVFVLHLPSATLTRMIDSNRRSRGRSMTSSLGDFRLPVSRSLRRIASTEPVSRTCRPGSGRPGIRTGRRCRTRRADGSVSANCSLAGREAGLKGPTSRAVP